MFSLAHMLRSQTQIHHPKRLSVLFAVISCEISQLTWIKTQSEQPRTPRLITCSSRTAEFVCFLFSIEIFLFSLCPAAGCYRSFNLFIYIFYGMCKSVCV